MSQNNDNVEALRAALAVSPDNLPLRRHLATTLVQLGRLDEAEREYRTALADAPDDPELKLDLAKVYYLQRKDSHALVIVEDLIRQKHPQAGVPLLYARLLLREGNVERAVLLYKQAVSIDASAADSILAEQLGVGMPEDSSSEVIDGRLRASHDQEEDWDAVEVERPDINFTDVGGMESLKDEIRMKIIHPLNHPELYEAYGKKIGGGILMYGPPGCGKTHMARATAGEVDASFISIGIHDVLDMWIGQSERNLHELFEQAREHRPCVLFFDEVDALGASRSDMKQSAGRQLINQFLSELDGMDASNDGVLVLAATNAPWHLDTAFRRPGRFDRIIFVPPPDAPARAAIMPILVKGKPTEDLDYDYLAKKTDGFSGADLKAVVDTAIEMKLQEAIKKGVPSPLTTKDLKSAARKLKPTTKEWFATARNYALYSNQGGFYDDILQYLKVK